MWNMNADELDVHDMREERVHMVRLINRKVNINSNIYMRLILFVMRGSDHRIRKQ